MNRISITFNFYFIKNTLTTEPDTGKLLAVVSKPDYDPENLDKDTWEALADNKDGSSRLLNRATQGLFCNTCNNHSIMNRRYHCFSLSNRRLWHILIF